VFGFSFSELLVISLVTLVAVGPQKLPGMLKTLGQWARKLRKMTLDVRQQTGIDEMLRAEGIQLSELRSLMRGYHGVMSPLAAPVAAPAPAPSPVVTSTTRYDDPYADVEPDPTREYPLEGADAYGALADDLLEPPASAEVAAAPGQPEAAAVAEQVAVASAPAETIAAAEETIAPAIPAEAAGPTTETTEAGAATTPSPAPAPRVGSPSAPEIEPEPDSEPRAAAPSPSLGRSAPPPPPSRAGKSSAPPPPPRRSNPASAAGRVVVTPPEAPPTPANPSSNGTANGNG